MTNFLITNENLKKSIEESSISQEQKNSLTFKIPHLNREQRLKLLELLEDISLLDIEEKEALEKIQKNWIATE